MGDGNQAVSLPNVDELLGSEPQTQALPHVDDLLGPESTPTPVQKTPPHLIDAYTGKMRELDDKYLGGLGRQAILAARAVPDAANKLVNTVPDAVMGTYDYARELANGRKPQLSDLWRGLDDPNLPSNVASSYADRVLPHPETGTERGAHAVEEFMSGAKMPIPGQAGDIRLNGQTIAPGDRPGDTRKALAILKKRLGRDSQSFEGAAAEVKAANDQGVPLRLTETGPNVFRTGDMLANRPGAAANIIRNDRAATLNDTKTRVPREVREATAADRGDSGAFTDQLSEFRSDNAKQNYENVKQDIQPVQDPQIENILKIPEVAKVWQDSKDVHAHVRSVEAGLGRQTTPFMELYVPRIRNDVPQPPAPATANPYTDRIGSLMQNAGIGSSRDFNAQNAAGRELPVPDSYQIPGTDLVRAPQAPDVRTLDYLQQRLSATVTGLYNAERDGEGGAGDLAAVLKDARAALVARLKDTSPSFKRAYETYGDDSEVMRANNIGRGQGMDSGDKEFLQMSPAQAQSYFSGLSESGKVALRMGFAERMLRSSELGGNNVDIAKQVLGGPEKEKLLRVLFDDDQSKFDAFVKTMKWEKRIFPSAGKILGGSPTDPRAAAAADFQSGTVPETVGNLATIGSQLHHGWIGSGVKGIIHLITSKSWNEGVASRVAGLLSSKDPQVTLDGLRQLEQNATAGATTRGGQRLMGATKGEQSMDSLTRKYQDQPQ